MKISEFTIEKSTVDCYKLRSTSGMWADITIDDNGTKGRIQIASDYGSWQNYWGACGVDFKSFLCGLDKHYVAGKFGANRWFDAEKTITEYRTVIKENIKDGYISKQKGISVLSELQSLEESSCQEEFYRNLEDCSGIMKLYDHCPSLIYGIDPRFNNFWDNIWPIFIDAIKPK